MKVCYIMEELNKRIEYITEITKYCMENNLSLEIVKNTNKTIFERYNDKIVIEFNEKDDNINNFLKITLNSLI